MDETSRRLLLVAASISYPIRMAHSTATPFTESSMMRRKPSGEAVLALADPPCGLMTLHTHTDLQRPSIMQSNSVAEDPSHSGELTANIKYDQSA
jgi:hypothetical protein